MFRYESSLQGKSFWSKKSEKKAQEECTNARDDENKAACSPLKVSLAFAQLMSRHEEPHPGILLRKLAHARSSG